MKQCPQCGKENESDAWLCACGYEFGGPEDAAPQGKWPPPVPKKRTSDWDGCIKSAAIAAAVVVVIGIAYGIVALMLIAFIRTNPYGIHH